MKPICLSLKLVTPMFMGGADQQAEFRIPSFKNLWRWWWRALHPKLDAAATAEENFLFGSGGAESRQGALNVRLAHPLALKSWDVNKMPNLNPALGYLGYGPLQYQKGLGITNLRSCLQPDQQIDIVVLLRGDVTNDQRLGLLRALQAMCLIGGVGARYRRGWGSLQLVNLNDKKWPIPNDTEAYGQRLLSAIDSFGVTKQPPGLHTCFSQDSWIKVKCVDGDWKAAMKTAGDTLIAARQNLSGANPNIPTIRWGKYKNDHHVMNDFLDAASQVAKEKATSAILKSPPERLALSGLPHNYFFSSPGKVTHKADFEVITEQDEALDRRSSPLFVHIEPLQNNKTLIVFTYLPSSHLFPAKSKLRVTARDRDGVHAISAEINAPTDFSGHKPLASYLDTKQWTTLKV